MIKTKVAVDLLQWIVIMGLPLHKCGATVKVVHHERPYGCPTIRFIVKCYYVFSS